ncbi:hypothetical protein V1264_021551 [Littorina saxatilis]|uniref:Uncharacterized protein n=2 Tax=Littorina saxatilis TaxID=31220 RepID=A0AAN9AIE8_9CAEN
MVKRGDLLKIFFIYLCLCHVVPGHPCGHNPLARFRPLARVLGKDVNYLLGLLREANPNLYNQLRADWRLYADCVGLVDTGYFKRSGGSSPASHLMEHDRQQDRDGAEEEVTSLEHANRAERLMNMMQRAAEAIEEASSSSLSSSSGAGVGDPDDIFMFKK